MKKLNLALTIGLLISTTASGQDGWQIEVISIEGTKPELALDSRGRPHLTYMTEALVGAVFYASKDDGDSWAIETVSRGYFYAPMDIVVDGADNIHIAYHDHDFEDLAYASKLDGQWSVEPISHQGHDGWDPALAIGQDGTVHIIAIDPLQFGTNDGIEYFSRRNDQWSVEGIGSGGILYEFGTGLAIDAEGRLHAVYHNGMSDQFRETGGGDLIYAVLENGTWFKERVDTEGDVGKFASLTLDNSGRPHIAYLDWNSPSAGRVKYAHFNGTSWDIEVVDDLEDIEIGHLGARRMTEVALDGQDRVYLAYSDRGVMKFASQTDDGWMIEEITGPKESGFVLGQFASLAVEANGRAHIAYYELPAVPRSSTGIILYAAGPAPVPTAILDDGDVTPDAFELGHSFPNPFNAEMVIPFTLPFDGPVEIAVFNLAGQQVRIIEGGQMRSGRHEARWDGRDGAGDEMASGVYAIRMVVGDFEQVRKAMLIR